MEVSGLQPAARGVRIVSANLQNGGAHAADFATLVHRLGADVVAVQELTPVQAEALATVLPHGRLEPGRDFDGMGIALRYPAVWSRIPLPCRDARLVQLQPEEWPHLGRPLEIISVHIAAPHISSLTQALRWRRGQLRRLIAYLDRPSAAARIVVGDFNATPLWPLYWRMRARLTDAAAEIARRQNRRPAPTWSLSSAHRPLLRIDHAFVGGVHIDNFAVVPIHGSDHHAIVLDASVG